ncbi:MAG: cytochrome b [Gemmatimonadales bacterium]|nr:MAG: cytochrome b [Gemmatimonadales bacterium]
MAADRGYGTVARLFHWVTVLLVFLMIPAGIAMTSEGFGDIRNELFIFHKGAGAVLLVLVLLRVAWRLIRPAPPMPESVPAAQRRLARWNHVLLYALLVVMTVSGYVRVVAGGFPIELLEAFGIPPLVPENTDLANRMSVLHKFSVYALMAFIGAHIAAASYHAFIARDGIAGRMWPPFRPRA